MEAVLSNEEEPSSSSAKAEATQKEVTPIEFEPMQRKVGSKLRILALHGHAQSAEGFRKKFGSIRGQCKKYVGEKINNINAIRLSLFCANNTIPKLLNFSEN